MDIKGYVLLFVILVACAVLSYTNYSAQKKAQNAIQESVMRQRLVNQIQEEDQASVSEKLDQLRQAEREAKERERQATKKEMEEELMLEVQAAKQRAVAREQRRIREHAWQDYYKTPESCVGILSGSVSNRCLQQKMDAKEAFLRQYNSPSEAR